MSSVREMRQLDRRAINQFYISGHILMGNAGRATPVEPSDANLAHRPMAPGLVQEQEAIIQM